MKTGLMVGLGETEAEVAEVLGDVAEAGVSMVTIGQYLRPTIATVLPVVEYVSPEVFEHYREVGEALGLLVQAGPFVRSSFQAGETFAASERAARKIIRCRATIARTHGGLLNDHRLDAPSTPTGRH